MVFVSDGRRYWSRRIDRKRCYAAADNFLRDAAVHLFAAIPFAYGAADTGGMNGKCAVQQCRPLPRHSVSNYQTRDHRMEDRL